MSSYLPRPDLAIDVARIGTTREPVLIINDFLADPTALVDAAAASPDWREVSPGGYPGRRAPLPRDYVRHTLRRLDGPIRARILSGDLHLKRFTCSFSMVTRGETELTPLQRVPHIDVADDNRIAVLHYLCDGRFGGTAFFRQQATGLEKVGAQDRDLYLEARRNDLANLRQSDGFPGRQTPGYTEIARIEARFNRLVAYRSATLHSGIIDDVDRLSADPRLGRLTANFFVDYGPSGQTGVH